MTMRILDNEDIPWLKKYIRCTKLILALKLELICQWIVAEVTETWKLKPLAEQVHNHIIFQFGPAGETILQTPHLYRKLYLSLIISCYSIVMRGVLVFWSQCLCCKPGPCPSWLSALLPGRPTSDTLAAISPSWLVVEVSVATAAVASFTV
jgi:hypothetical protein